MQWNIIADSSSDLQEGIKCAKNVSFYTVPLIIRVGNRDFVDDATLNVDEMIEAFHQSRGASSSSCPSIDAWIEKFRLADCSFAVTISSALSGTYNTAVIAKEHILRENPNKKIHIIDSLSTSGAMALIVWRINSLIDEGLSFETIVEKIEAYRKELCLIVSLSSYENLVKNGRMNRILGLVVSKLRIRLICEATAKGTIGVLKKARGESRTFSTILQLMAEKKPEGFSHIVISHCKNIEGVHKLKALIDETYNNVKVTILETHGLTSYYSELHGIIVCF